MMNAGRKRTFDKDEALDKAMRVFWENGYSGTSLSDLTSELSINKPSLYAAFGNKEQLFEASLKHYMTQYGIPKMQLLAESSNTSLKERLKVYLYALIDLFTDNETPNGCFIVKSSCESGSAAFPAEVSSSLKEMGLATEKVITKFLKIERTRGEIPDDVSLKVASGYLLSVMYGLAVLARTGKTKKTLRANADFAISAFPARD